MGAYAESIDKLVENFQELRPTVQVSVPQIFDRIYNRVRQMLDSGSPLKRRIFQWAVDVGRKTAPYRHQNQSLPFFSALKHAVAHRLVFSKIHNVFGGRVKYLTALITLNESELKIFAGRENLAQIEPAALTDHQKVRQAVSDHVQAVNIRLAPYEQIKRFTILPRDFSEEAGELTPTLKIRRREIIKRYGDKIESLYGE
jgi:long-subunit acyl-CoA synthetase (AMP-forming)